MPIQGSPALYTPDPSYDRTRIRALAVQEYAEEALDRKLLCSSSERERVDCYVLLCLDSCFDREYGVPRVGSMHRERRKTCSLVYTEDNPVYFLEAPSQPHELEGVRESPYMLSQS